MTMKTQGTDLYTIDPDTGEVLDAGCVTQISGIDITIEQIETTCLKNSERTYVSGLGTPGTAQFTIQTDPRDPVHVRLLELKKAGATLQWAVGWSDNTDLAPQATTDSDGTYVFDLPEERSWLVFEGFMNSYPFEFAPNSVVTSAVGIQVSGDIVMMPRSAT